MGYIKLKIAALFAFLAVPFSASAALPESVTTALATAATDAGILWLALLGIALVAVGFKMGVFGARKAPAMLR